VSLISYLLVLLAHCRGAALKKSADAEKSCVLSLGLKGEGTRPQVVTANVAEAKANVAAVVGAGSANRGGLRDDCGGFAFRAQVAGMRNGGSAADASI